VYVGLANLFLITVKCIQNLNYISVSLTAAFIALQVNVVQLHYSPNVNGMVIVGVKSE